MKDFIAELMQRMTLEEKIGQLNLVAPGGFCNTGPEVTKNAGEKIRNGQVGGMFGFFGVENVKPYQDIAVKESRLGIPLIFGLDVIHGHQTVFPIPLALSCTWDMGLIEKTARVAATEAAADGLDWTFSPMVDISRDPRWGRVAEGAGEDPYLGSEIAKAMVRGYQGGDMTRDDAILSCVKHFALYGAPDGGRDYNTVDMSRIKMHECYFPPYKAAIEAGAGSVMTSFNEVDGVPASANRWLMTEVLRDQWGFKGFVVTDYTAINEMTLHGLGDLKTVAARALKAGVDMDMVGEGFVSTLKKSIEDGEVTVEQVDAACRRILEAKQKLGLFDNPYRRIDENRKAERILTPEHRAFARECAAKSCVLLKNGGGALPLKKSGTIAVVGPLADDRRNMPGTWAIGGDWQKCVTLLEGIRSSAGEAKIVHARGANIVHTQAQAERLAIYGNNRVEIDPRPSEEMIAEAVAAAKGADVVVACVGEAQEMAGEAASRTDIGIPEAQKPLLRALAATGKPLVLVFFSGRPLTLEWEHDNAAALLAVWFGGTEAGNGVADVLFGDVVPAGKITATFPRNVGQVPVYYNHKNTGRPWTGQDGPEAKFKSRYLDVENTPLYPFGHGLSYTVFEYSAVELDRVKISGDGVLRAAVTVSNTGEVAGEEVVQLYITDPAASVARAVKELKGFRKISLKPGERKEVIFDITPEQLKFYDSDLEHVWEPGVFIIHIGPNSADVKSASVTWERGAGTAKASQAA